MFTFVATSASNIVQAALPREQQAVLKTVYLGDLLQLPSVELAIEVERRVIQCTANFERKYALVPQRFADGSLRYSVRVSELVRAYELASAHELVHAALSTLTPGKCRNAY